jgi:hypothetical protein
MANPRDDLADKALEAVQQRYSSPPKETVEGPDFRGDDDRAFKELESEKVQRDAMTLMLALRRTIIERCPEGESRTAALQRLRESWWWTLEAMAGGNDQATPTT